jgi:DNA-binding GntR family transcriptional regulator
MSAGKREERQLPSRTIAEAIRTKIESGELRPRAKLPSERDLASTYRPGVAVLGVWHASFDQGGEPYELTRLVMRGDMTGLLYDVPAG